MTKIIYYTHNTFTEIKLRLEYILATIEDAENVKTHLKTKTRLDMKYKIDGVMSLNKMKNKSGIYKVAFTFQ